MLLLREPLRLPSFLSDLHVTPHDFVLLSGHLMHEVGYAFDSGSSFQVGFQSDSLSELLQFASSLTLPHTPTYRYLQTVLINP
jgi:hypothetical protein